MPVGHEQQKQVSNKTTQNIHKAWTGGGYITKIKLLIVLFFINSKNAFNNIAISWFYFIFIRNNAN